MLIAIECACQSADSCSNKGLHRLGTAAQERRGIQHKTVRASAHTTASNADSNSVLEAGSNVIQDTSMSRLKEGISFLIMPSATAATAPPAAAVAAAPAGGGRHPAPNPQTQPEPFRYWSNKLSSLAPAEEEQ